MAPGISKRPKTEEFRCSLEVADIIGELHILKQLLQDQIDAFNRARKEIRRVLWVVKSNTPQKMATEALTSLRQKFTELSSTIRDDCFGKVMQLIASADRAQKDILNLLHLQQKQDNVDEAHSSNQTALLTAKQILSSQSQADATNAQSWILFIITFVTIVFLPLSFFTSHYGMNVSDHNNSQMLRKTSYVWKVMGGSTFPIITLLSLGGVAFFFRSKEQAKTDRIEDLAFLKKNDALPSILFKEDDPMYRKIEQRTEEMRKEDRAKRREEEKAKRRHGEPGGE